MWLWLPVVSWPTRTCPKKPAPEKRTKSDPVFDVLNASRVLPPDGSTDVRLTPKSVSNRTDRINYLILQLKPSSSPGEESPECRRRSLLRNEGTGSSSARRGTASAESFDAKKKYLLRDYYLTIWITRHE